jgi:hypothetical protein
MTRHGKIARLPRSVREELNQRLADGEPGRHLLTWLNALPAVRTVLAAYFDGRPITGTNLTMWKQGGFDDWQRREDAREWMGLVMEDSDDLTVASGTARLADRVAVTLLMELARLLREAVATDQPAERRKAVLEVARQFDHQRHADHRVERARMARERLEMTKEAARKKRPEKDAGAREGEPLPVDHFPDPDDFGQPTGPGGLEADVAHLLSAINAHLVANQQKDATPDSQKLVSPELSHLSKFK